MTGKFAGPGVGTWNAPPRGGRGGNPTLGGTFLGSKQGAGIHRSGRPENTDPQDPDQIKP